MTHRAKRIIAALAVLAALVLGAGGYYAWRGAGILAGFGAKVLCSCVFVTGREPAACFAEELGAYPMLGGTVDRTRGSVTVAAFGVRRARARFQRDLGCTLE